MTLADLQKALIKYNYDACIVTRSNMFLGQDILPAENKIQELCGFTGSAGTMLVFRNKTYLFVDGRYELQAAQEVDTALITVVCTKETLATWIANNLGEPCTIAYDAWCHPISEVDYWNRALKKHTFVDDGHRLLGSRIETKECEIFEHDIRFAGVSMDEKISYLTDFMQQNRLDAYFIAECDAVSWLLNLRSDCLPETPIIRAFALVDKSGEVSLFTNDFTRLEVELSRCKGMTIGLSYAHTPKQIQTIMKNHKIWLNNLQNPVQLWKAVKNPVELAGIKAAHRRDAVALIKFLCWLEQNWQGQDELSVVAKLREFRAAGENFFSDSFAAIAAFGSNGAVVHYHPAPETNQKLAAGSVLLLDSGAQYFDGTTDVTRTLAFGRPPQEIIDSFTQVLKAHIAAASAYFPAGVSGCSLDALARAQLWSFGKDYNHGTGHGVGCFLNVHEGPHSLSSRSQNTPLQPNMITSIEPGYYKTGAYGIRIENLVYVTPADNSAFPLPMNKFEPLTLVPLDKRLISKYLLNRHETAWLNAYHQRVEQEISPLLDEPHRRWLHTACAPI